MPSKTRLPVVAAAIALFALPTLVRAYEPNHYDTTIDYQTCDGSKWSAVLEGNGFRHTAWANGEIRRSTNLDFKTWSGECASGFVDTAGFRVTLQGKEFRNTTLNYTAADASKYAAYSAQGGFYHVFVGRPDNKSSLGDFDINKVIEFLDKNKEIITVIISYL